MSTVSTCSSLASLSSFLAPRSHNRSRRALLAAAPLVAALGIGLAARPAHAQLTLYVSNASGNTIQKFSSAGVASQFASSAQGLNGPVGLAFGSTAAPEPSALLLLAPGALTAGMVGIRARRTSRKRDGRRQAA